MGDHYQDIVDRDVSLEDAGALAGQMLDWLTAEGIILPERTARVLGGDGMGYPAGRRFERVVDPSTEAELLQRMDGAGMNVVVKRSVFTPMYGVFDLLCRFCNVRTRDLQCGTPPEADRGFIAAVNAWFAGDDLALLACPWCGREERLTEWTIEPPWGFGNLGFEFWIWPLLGQAFLAEFSRRLGHRTLLVMGKI